eukprot:500406_1
MSCLTQSLFRVSKNMIAKRYMNMQLYGYKFSTLIENIDDDFNLETQLNVLAMDEAMIEESSITNEKLENIFSKIRQTATIKTDNKKQISSNVLKFEDLFPLKSQFQQEEQQQEDKQLEEYTKTITTSIDESITRTNDKTSIDFLIADDILNIPSTAITKQILSTNDNTIDNFGINLYNLLRYNPSGIVENDIQIEYLKHFGCEYPFKYESSMIKYIIGYCSHLFIIHSDILGKKIIFNRANIENEKYLNFDDIPYLKQSQILHYLL